MLSTKQLIANLRFQPKEILVKKEHDFDFNNKRKAYILKSGEIISYGERDYTQLLKKNDPIGFAESILSKPKILKYKRLTDIILLEFDAKEIRDAVQESNIVVKALIKYSLARIFSASRVIHKSHYLFEDEFVYKNWKLLDTKTYNEEAIIFAHGNSATNMFFIEKGKVKVQSFLEAFHGSNSLKSGVTAETINSSMGWHQDFLKSVLNSLTNEKKIGKINDLYFLSSYTKHKFSKLQLKQIIFMSLIIDIS